MALSKEQGEQVWLSRWEDWKERAAVKHGGKYLYPSPVREGNKIRILCPEHGEFSQLPAKHMHGQGCSKCAGRGADRVAQMKAQYPEWDWSGVVFGNTKDKLILTCQTHGVFETTLNRLSNKREGLSPCPSCARDSGGAARRIASAEWNNRVKSLFEGRVTLDESTSHDDKSRFECNLHGEFFAKLSDVVNGHGCPACGQEKRQSWMGDNLVVSADEFLQRALELNGDRYEYDLSTFTRTNKQIRIICKEHGEFWQIARNHLTLQAQCPRCSNSVSKGEDEIADYLSGLGYEVKRRQRVLDGKELDIVVPELNLAIEYCGVYWHGENYKEPDYHAMKLSLARAKGFRLITVFEDEWVEQKDKVKWKLINLLGGDDKIYARNTEIAAVDWPDAKAFLTIYHLQGAGKPTAKCYALKHLGEIVALITWGEDRFSNSGYLEMYRFCMRGGVRVVGGLSKLIKNSDTGGRNLVTYADLRWGDGEGYGKVGFTKVGETKPGYFWCKGISRFNRQGFQKHKLQEKLKVFDPSLSESDNCRNNGYWKTYDCGHAKWELRHG